ncbi:MAG: SUMF1/EgtB/PvdO family nonheme iron enzyme [Deltaproteobacteria bacterium]|nr:SUMF1/EgtB/PvdO family nonheme iron enzyme [Deltaproteobacteria bacterium]
MSTRALPGGVGFGPFRIVGVAEPVGLVDVLHGFHVESPNEPLVVFASIDPSVTELLTRGCREWELLDDPDVGRVVSKGEAHLPKELGTRWSGIDAAYAASPFSLGVGLDELFLELESNGAKLPVPAAIEIGLGMLRVLCRIEQRFSTQPPSSSIRLLDPHGVSVTRRGIRLRSPAVSLACAYSDPSDPPLSGSDFAFFAPEEVLGKKCELISKEVYRVGLTLFRLLSGVSPFVGTNPMEILKAVAQGGRCRWPPSSGQKALQDLVDECMRLGPDDRPRDLRALLSEIESLSSGGASELILAVTGTKAWSAAIGSAACYELPEQVISDPRQFRGTTLVRSLRVAVDSRPVTCAEYGVFLEVSGRLAPKQWPQGVPPPGTEDQPVTWVRHGDAQDYARFRKGRLPTEEEWERIATSEGLGATGFGEVWEWTDSPWPGSHLKVVRGGRWRDHPEREARATNRSTEGDRAADVGFRCVYDVSPVVESPGALVSSRRTTDIDQLLSLVASGGQTDVDGIGRTSRAGDVWTPIPVTIPPGGFESADASSDPQSLGQGKNRTNSR